MAETDRIARLETAFTGRNAWNIGWQWADSYGDLIYNRPDGSKRELGSCYDRDKLIAFSNTLDGSHGNLLKHMRDKNPLRSNDPMADIMIGILRQTSPELLRRLSDDPQGFRDLWSFVWQRAKEPPEPAYLLLDGKDVNECRKAALKTINRYRSFYRSLDAELDRLTDGGYGCMIMYETAIQAEIRLKRYSWDERGRWCMNPMMTHSGNLEILLEPDSTDWRHKTPHVHGTISTGFAYRPNDGHQWDEPKHHATPERLAGAIIRQLKGKGLL